MGLIGPLGPIGDVVYCSDEDFKTLVMLAEKLLRHAALMTLLLPEEEQMLETQIVSDEDHHNVENRANQLYDLMPDKFSTSEAYAMGLKEMGRKSRTIDKYLGYLVENKRIINSAKGIYEKVQ